MAVRWDGEGQNYRDGTDFDRNGDETSLKRDDPVGPSHPTYKRNGTGRDGMECGP